MEPLRELTKEKNPRNNASWLSKLLFCYVSKTLVKGYKEDLSVSDLYETIESLSSLKLSADLTRELKRGKDDKNLDHDPSAFMTFTKTNKTLIMLLGIFQFFWEATHVLNAFLVGYLIDYFAAGAHNKNTTTVIIYGTVIAALTAFSSIGHHINDYHLECLGLKLRSVISSLVYEKLTRLSQGAFANTSAGNIINVVSSDAHKLLGAFFFFNYFWIIPIKLVVVFALLYISLGVSALPGIALLLSFIPLQIYLGSVFAKLRKKVGGLTDERVKLTSEVLKGMRAIKMYTWEEPFCKIIQESRRKEIKMIMVTQVVRTINTAIFVCMPYLCGAVMFTMYYLQGNPLTTTNVFSTLALLQLVRFSLCIFFPIAVQRAAEALASMKRVQTFLNLDEKICTNLISQPLSPEDPKPYVNFSNVSASWKDKKEALTLNDINIQVEKEEPLLIIVGAVGSGKTSLLMSICGEIPILNGTVKVNGKVSYASQVPWIFSGTVRQNILFAEPFVEDKYKAVISACALNKDFKQLADGDMTFVGERGVCLSGGQKARISLARAVYRDADIYLLDDPLSAVDSQVGNHIFEKCISGYLKDKITLLVTHQTQYLKSASRILCIEKGKQLSYGKFDDIMESDFDALSILSESSAQEAKAQQNSEVSTDTVKVVLAENRLQRASSTISNAFVEEDGCIIENEPMLLKRNGKTQNKEDVIQGTVGLKMYLQYFSAGGGTVLTVLMFSLCILTQLSLTGVDWWLGEWSNAEEAKMKNATLFRQNFNNYFHGNPNNNLYLYLGWILFTCCLVFSSVSFFYYIIINSSKCLHNKMLSSILKAPMYFFDTTQTGVILNRFAKDIFFLDDELPWTFQDFLLFSLFSLNAVVLSCMAIPYLIPVIALLLVAFLYLRSYYLVSARKVKRIEGISRSPMFAHFSETLEGLPTIRASQAVDVVIKEFYQCQDHQSDGWYMFFSTSKWFGQRLDIIVLIFVVAAIYSPIVAAEFSSVNPTLAGLSLVYALQLCIFFQWCVRQSAQVENYMTSAERVMEYCNLAPEPDVPFSFVPPDWPKSGKIESSNVSFSYHDSLPTALTDLTFCINDGEKVGVIGRTGAGKSSLFSAMFRTGPVHGDLIFDGIHNKSVSLYDWRKNFSIIPQDPVLFGGSLRMNIDPFSQFEDSEIWDVLEQVQLKDYIADQPLGLSLLVSEGGSNFSVGERQLLCLARALLLKKRVLFIDEATANVDKETDSLIQDTIQERFRNSTVVTIAHRLNTIMSCDRIMVLDAGKIVQFDEPVTLYGDKNGIMYKLVQETGEEEAEKLYNMALDAKLMKENQCS